MPLDGIAVAHIVRELREALTGGRVEKIRQPEEDEVVLTVKKGQLAKLLLSASARTPRAHLTAVAKDNPMNAPLFCMVLRKHLLGGRVTDVSQTAGFERVINIDISAVNEMGDMAQKRLVIEIMGKHSNIILVDAEGVIVDSVKRVGHGMSSVREVLPGRAYTPPPGQDKYNPAAYAGDAEAFAAAMASCGETAARCLSGRFMGISPATAEEIVYRSGIDGDRPVAAQSGDDIGAVFTAFSGIVTDAVTGVFYGDLAYDEAGKPVDFAPYRMTRYPVERRKAAYGMSELLDAFYAERDHQARISQKSQDLRRLITVNIERCVKKGDAHLRTMKEVEGRDRHRLYGELLTANLYRLTSGMKSAVLENYNEPGTTVEVPLDTRLTPIENAQRYYKRYNKEKRAAEALKEQTEQNAAELRYLESVMASLAAAECEADLNELRDELAEQGFAKRRASARKTQKPRPTEPLSYTSSDGFIIMVGKNNRQNDELTQKSAAPDDIWLHAKDIPGSHVIIKANGGAVPDITLEEAAALAAKFSKAAASGMVPVDYTLRKYVRKPAGAKPGMVIYTNQRTAYVRPGEPRTEQMQGL